MRVTLPILTISELIYRGVVAVRMSLAVRRSLQLGVSIGQCGFLVLVGAPAA